MANLALTGVRVWDGEADELSEPQTLRIEGDRIAELGAAPHVARGATVYPMDGATALPGLIDAHVHLTLDPDIFRPDYSPPPVTLPNEEASFANRSHTVAARNPQRAARNRSEWGG